MMYRETLNKMKVGSDLSSWEEAHSKLISASEDPAHSIDSLDGAQLEEIIAATATPLDLSVFNNPPTKVSRNAESPLDLSLKTRKRIADSTEEEDGLLRYAFGNMPALKRVCPGVSSVSDTFMDMHSNALVAGCSSKNVTSVASKSHRESLSNNHGQRRDIKPVCDIKTQSVIKHGFLPNSQVVQHSIPHIGSKVIATSHVPDRKNIYNERVYSDIDHVKNSHNRTNDRKMYNKQVVPIAQNPPSLVVGQESSKDAQSMQRQRFYKQMQQQHLQQHQSHQNSRHIPGHQFESAKRRNPHIVIGGVSDTPSAILQYHQMHTNVLNSMNSSAPFVETVQRCSPDSTIPVHSPSSISPIEIDNFDEKMRQKIIAESLTSKYSHNKQISFPHGYHQHSHKYNHGFYNDANSTLNPVHVSSSSVTSSPCGMTMSRDRSPALSSDGSPLSFVGAPASPLSSRSHMYISHLSRSRENSPLGARSFPHSLSPLVHPPYTTSHALTSHTNTTGKTFERSVNTQEYKVQERSILKGTSGLHRPQHTQYNHTINDSHSISVNCDKKRTLPDRPYQNALQQAKQTQMHKHIPPSSPSAHVYMNNKMDSSNYNKDTRVKIEIQDNSPKGNERRYVLKDTPTPVACMENAIKVEKSERSTCKENNGNSEQVSLNSSHTYNVNSSLQDEKSEGELDRYSHPLTIAIPSTTASTISDNGQQNKSALKSPEPPATSVRAPRPFSKKQIIMNAVNNDECLKKIVNSPVVPRPVKQDVPPVPSDHLSTPHRHQRCQSPSFPESPKMPTLSPQQKLPPALVTPLTVEPPTLAPAASLNAQRLRHESGAKISLMRRMTSFGANEVKTDFDSESKQNENIIKDENKQCHTIIGGNAFGKRQGYSKNIPIANVSPMVHGSCAKPANNFQGNNGVIRKADSQKRDRYKMENNQIKQNMEDKPCKKSAKYGEYQSCNTRDKFTEYLDDDVYRQTEVHFVHIEGARVTGRSDHREKCPEEILDLKQDHVVSKEDIKDNVKWKQLDGDCVMNRDVDDQKMEQKHHHKTLLNEIANSDGYISESKALTKSDDLMLDPSLLGREERALRRAILQFDELDETEERPTTPKSPSKLSTTQRVADELRRKARKARRSRNDRLLGRQKWIGRRKRKKKMKQKGFIDFQPEVISSRTRTQAGQKPLTRYDRNAAYERELSRDEKRKAKKRRERLRQTARRICRRMNQRLDEQHRLQLGEKSGTEGQSSEQMPVNDGSAMENDDTDRNGMWEVGGTSNALKQTLRSGKSKGGLMLKLLFKPQKTKYRFGRRHSPRHSVYQLRTSPLSDRKLYAGVQSRKNNLDIGSKLKHLRRRQQIARQRLTDRRQQKIASERASSTPFLLGDIPNEECSESTARDQLDTNEYSSNPSQAEVKKLAVCRDTGETTLHRAARMGHKDIALHCLQSGRVDVNVRDNAGYTPLHESCVRGHLEIANMLLGYGANVNCSSQDGIRPIHDAVENDHVELVRMLLSFGADPTLSTYSGKTPLKIARSEKLRKLLEGHLGDLNGFADDQEETVWEFPFTTSANDNQSSSSVAIFSDIPSDPEEEDVENHFLQSSEPAYSDFRLIKADGKLTRGSYVLLNDVTDFNQVQLKEIINDSKLKSMFTSISKKKLAMTSYGMCHGGRLDTITDTKCKVIRVKELPKLSELCKMQYSRDINAIDESKSVHKFKHYKCMKSSEHQSNKQEEVSCNKNVERMAETRTKPEVESIPSPSVTADNSVHHPYTYFSHSRKIKLLPSPPRPKTYPVNQSYQPDHVFSGYTHTLDDNRGYRNNPGPSSREYHTKYLDFLKERDFGENRKHGSKNLSTSSNSQNDVTSNKHMYCSSPNTGHR